MSDVMPSVNEALAAAIRSAGCSHAGLARRINKLGAARGMCLAYDKTAVSHWLSGTQPRPQVRFLIAEALSEKLHRPVTLAELGLAEPEAPSCTVGGLLYQRSIGPTISTLMELAKLDIERRSLLKMAPFLAGALVAPQRDWLLHLLGQENTSPPAETSAPADALLEMGRVFEDLDNRLGGGHARLALVQYLREQVTPLLRLPHPDGQRQRLFTAAAHLVSTAGWMTYDSGDLGLAQRYMTQALRLCAEGGELALANQIFAGLSHLTISAGSPQEGLNLALTGLATAKQTDSRLGLMRLHAMRARAHAALGERRQATQAITAAEHALDASPGPDNESQWGRFLNASFLAAETAACMQDVGDHAAAQRFAAMAAAGTGQLGRRQTISLAVLATAQLDQPSRDLEGAVDNATKALNGMAGISSQRSAKALNDVRRRLAPFRREAIVREFELAATARLRVL
ncbi:hypothetical protein GCM10027280_01490 [Micromonospora polyrhachis]|uniref:Transcriptional regulator n=1 Tax=Micromonospora polyrhachis TaxID=1282883 RepID=A0A7W7WNI3_9ACTN|nr:hypothetical protein [Micromonospora polyrhachis]MBB4957559.1 hypothetical protein [Micromonospora polyrhachis]